MKSYIEIPVKSANRLINHGPTVLVSTKDSSGIYDIAPIAWNSPVHKDPPRLLVVVGTRHKTFDNISASGEFIVCVPHISQVDMVRKAGSVSGRDVDKFNQLGIETFAGKKVDALVPAECVGYLECKVNDCIRSGMVGIIVADILAAGADKQSFDGRLLVEREAGKTIHHLGGSAFAIPESRIFDE